MSTTYWVTIERNCGLKNTLFYRCRITCHCWLHPTYWHCICFTKIARVDLSFSRISLARELQETADQIIKDVQAKAKNTLEIGKSFAMDIRSDAITTLAWKIPSSRKERGAQSVGILFLLLNYQSCLAGHVMKTRWRAFQLCLWAPSS